VHWSPNRLIRPTIAAELGASLDSDPATAVELEQRFELIGKDLEQASPPRAYTTPDDVPLRGSNAHRNRQAAGRQSRHGQEIFDEGNDLLPGALETWRKEVSRRFPFIRGAAL